MLKAKKHRLMSPSNQAAYNVIFTREYVNIKPFNVFLHLNFGKLGC